MYRRTRDDGTLIESYDKIYEYKLNADGSLTLRTPALELREFCWNKTTSRYYFTVDEAGKTIQVLGKDFLEIKKASTVFRFLGDDDAGNRKAIADELMRRAASFQEAGEKSLRRAEELRKIAGGIR